MIVNQTTKKALVNGLSKFFNPKTIRSGRTYHNQSLFNAKYHQPNEKDISALKEILKPNRVIPRESPDHDNIFFDKYNEDWIGQVKGDTSVVLFPETTEQLSKTLKYCNDKMIAVVPQGGNTGLVAGSIPLYNEAILSLEKMDNIISFDEISGILVCEAGCILQNLDEWLRERGFIMPLDLGAKGQCQIGGNVSTNAGGLRYIRYGSLHGSVLGLEVVLPNGMVLDMLSTMRKDNTGYDLKQLFIGAEGSLGVVTKVSIQVPRLPEAINVAFLACSTYKSIQDLFVCAKKQLGEILSATEFMDNKAITQVFDHGSQYRNPFDEDYPFYMLIETSGSNAVHDLEKLESFLESVYEQGIIQNGVVAQDQQQQSALWSLREMIPVAFHDRNGNAGIFDYEYKYDISIPLPDMYDLVEEMRDKFEKRGYSSTTRLIGYGHLGDSNLHLNVKADRSLIDVLEPFIFEWVQSKKGSISAEHGLGSQKNKYLPLSKDENVIEIMKEVKKLFDKHQILNPYKVLPVDP